jgi:hypothetical protein
MQERAPIQVHTLGPAGTNCEAAAKFWIGRRRDNRGTIVLHPSLESAVSDVLEACDDSVLLACVVYPRLHEIVFRNLEHIELRDCFVMPTHRMVLAARVMPCAESPKPFGSIASHPAPVDLVAGSCADIRMARSNSEAAQICARGETDACITTVVAANSNDLAIVRDFGSIQMGFSIHANPKIDIDDVGR